MKKIYKSLLPVDTQGGFVPVDCSRRDRWAHWSDHHESTTDRWAAAVPVARGWSPWTTEESTWLCATPQFPKPPSRSSTSSTYSALNNNKKLARHPQSPPDLI
jgi:hypothetical protein